MGNENHDKDLRDRVSENPSSTEQTCTKDDERTICDTHEGVTIGGAEESWLPIETKLVTRSIIIGIVALIILATLIHTFILGGH